MATLRILSAAALPLLASLAPAQAGAPEALDFVLADDDECFAAFSEGTGGVDSSRCALSALQLRRKALQLQPGQIVHSAFKEVLSMASLTVGPRGPPVVLEQEGETCQALLQSFQECLPASSAKPSLANMKQMCSCRSMLKDMKVCPRLKPVVALEKKIMAPLCSQCGLALVNFTATEECMGNHSFSKSAVCGAVCQPLACSALDSCPEGIALPGSSKEESLEGEKKLKDAMAQGGCACSAALADTDVKALQPKPGQTVHSALKEVLSMASLTVGPRGPPMVLEQEGETCQALLQSFQECLPASSAKPSLANMKQMCSCRPMLQDMKACPSLLRMAEQQQKYIDSLGCQCALAMFSFFGDKNCSESTVCGGVCQPRACSILRSCPLGIALPGSSTNESEAALFALEDSMAKGGCSFCAPTVSDVGGE